MDSNQGRQDGRRKLIHRAMTSFFRLNSFILNFLIEIVLYAGLKN